jgi:hypothetical protein
VEQQQRERLSIGETGRGEKVMMASTIEDGAAHPELASPPGDGRRTARRRWIRRPSQDGVLAEGVGGRLWNGGIEGGLVPVAAPDLEAILDAGIGREVEIDVPGRIAGDHREVRRESGHERLHGNAIGPPTPGKSSHFDDHPEILRPESPIETGDGPVLIRPGRVGP